MSCKIQESRYCGSKPTSKLHRDDDPYSRDEVHMIAKNCGLKLSTQGRQKTMTTLCSQLRSCSRGHSCPRSSSNGVRTRSKGSRSRRAAVRSRRSLSASRRKYAPRRTVAFATPVGPYGGGTTVNMSTQTPSVSAGTPIAASAPPLANDSWNRQAQKWRNEQPARLAEVKRIQNALFEEAKAREQRKRNTDPFYNTNDNLFFNAQNRIEANRKAEVRRERKALREALQAGNPYNADNNLFFDAEEPPGFWNRFFPNVQF